MNGLDFFGALQAKGIDLPIRLFIGDPVPNYYRPDALSFCNLTIDDEEEITAQSVPFLCGKSVYLLADEASDRVRSIAKTLMSVEPALLVVKAGDVLTSWSHGRGWK